MPDKHVTFLPLAAKSSPGEPSWAPSAWMRKPGLVEVNFDNDKDVLRKFGVQSQSTLIVFKGAKEVGRSAGESDPARIQALIEKGL